MVAVVMVAGLSKGYVWDVVQGSEVTMNVLKCSVVWCGVEWSDVVWCGEQYSVVSKCLAVCYSVGVWCGVACQGEMAGCWHGSGMTYWCVSSGFSLPVQMGARDGDGMGFVAQDKPQSLHSWPRSGGGSSSGSSR